MTSYPFSSGNYLSALARGRSDLDFLMQEYYRLVPQVRSHLPTILAFSLLTD